MALFGSWSARRMKASPYGVAIAAFIALTAGILAAPSPALALTVQNCTGVEIRVNVYRNDDVLQLVAEDDALIAPGGGADVGPSDGAVAIKIFATGLIDAIRLATSNVDAGGAFVVQDAGGDAFALSPGGAC